MGRTEIESEIFILEVYNSFPDHILESGNGDFSRH